MAGPASPEPCRRRKDSIVFSFPTWVSPANPSPPEKPPPLPMSVFFLLLLLCCLRAASAAACIPSHQRSLLDFAGGLVPGSLPGWNSSGSADCCRWTGVQCGNSTGGVEKLDLSNMGLAGAIATGSLGSISGLAELLLVNNSLSGSLPEDLLRLPSLKLLNLSRNGFNGSLPANISLPSLKFLDLSFTNLSGSLPDTMFNSSSLAKLYLQSSKFQGPLPRRLGDLSGLVELDASSNNFSRSPIPDVFDRLKNLSVLNLASNSFVGKLPPSLSNLRRLRNLNLNRNSLAGRIDLNFSNLPELMSIDLGSNFFNGSIPTELLACRKLRSINLARNKLRGEIPTGFRDLVVLESLSLSNNSFTNFTSALQTLQHCPNLTTLVVTINFRGDVLPADGITGFQSLQLLVAANCRLTGVVPQWLSRCGKLQLLDLSWNKLNGSIPPWFGDMSFLFYIDLSNNTLTGVFPVELTSMAALRTRNSSSGSSASSSLLFFSKQGSRVTALQYNRLSSFPPTLDFGHNYLHGPIPHEIGRLQNLHVLALSHNSLDGSIPEELENLTSLEILDLSANNLTGKIPQSLTRLSFLSTLNLSYNNLEGEIPTGYQFGTFNFTSYAGNPRLCGAPLNRSCRNGTDPNSSPAGGKSGHNVGTVVGIAVGTGLGLSLLFLLIYLVVSRTKSRRIEDTQRELNFGSRHLDEQSGSSVVLLFQSKEPDSLSVHDILTATGNFDQANIIGCGGFGLVYKATLPNGWKVAIKRLSGEYGQMEREFQAEVQTLSRAQHKNLVPLNGYCMIGSDRLLIYSYMENGSLDFWLHENEQAMLDWPRRLGIARGAAGGLSYLHQSCDPHILHRDIKSSNILLDSNFEAHLADFGLARLLLPCDTHVTTDLVGTLGYIPPEYAHSPVATMKGDVYSFGVVLLELLTGRRPMDICRPKESRELISWVMRMRDEGRESEVFDEKLYENGCAREMERVLEVACRCLRDNPKERPTIQQIVTWLDDVGN